MKLLTNLLVFFLLLGSFLISAQPQVKIDSLKRLFAETGLKDREKLVLLNQLGFEFWTIDPAQSEYYGLQAAGLAVKLGDTISLAMAHRVIGVSHWSRGNFISALEHLYKSQEFYKMTGDGMGEANSTMNVGLVLVDQKDYSLALSHFFMAKKLFESLGNEERIASVQNNIGWVYLETGQTQLAEQSLSEALQIHRKINYSFGILECTNRLGLLYLIVGQHQQALSFLNESLEISRTNKDHEHTIKNLENIARVRIEQHQYSDAEKMLAEALPIAQNKNYKKLLRDIYLDYKNIYQARKQFEKALYYADQHEILKESIFSEEKAAQLANLKMQQEAAAQQHALKLQQQEIALLQQKKKIDKLSLLSLFSILIVVVVTGGFLFRSQRTRYKKKQERARLDLMEAKQIEQELKQTLHFKDKELTSYTMNFIRKNELIEELGNKIQLLRKKLPEQSQELNSILHLAQNNSIDKDWEDFKTIFENVHNNFFGKLLERHPDLTPNDLKLCALLQMNLSIKEMASLMGISPDSVKTSRYRLRKKLGLTQDQSLSEFIMNYT